MNYQETVDFLLKQLPVYQRDGAKAIRWGLDNAHYMDNYFHFPHTHYPTIHVAGTNGKGSTSHMLASILYEAGYKTALYTSPHLLDLRERARVNGAIMSKQFVIDFVEQNRILFEEIKPSFFEITAFMAFEYFRQQQVDVAVIEVGLGGRLDCTNIIRPVLSIITNIGFDHTYLLGDTLEKIAFEKAGIIKPSTPVIINERQPECENVFRKIAEENNAPIHFANEEISIRKTNDKLDVSSKNITLKNILPGLRGNYQSKNIAGVVCASLLLKNDFITLSNNTIIKGIENVIPNTGLRGRWEILSTSPLTICDIGHNKEAIAYIVSQLKHYEVTKIHFIIGLANDKDSRGILSILPLNALYYFTKASIPRALNENELQKTAKDFSLLGNSYQTVAQAINAAQSNCKPGEMIFIGGSAFVVAETLIHYH